MITPQPTVFPHPSILIHTLPMTYYLEVNFKEFIFSVNILMCFNVDIPANRSKTAVQSLLL